MIAGDLKKRFYREVISSDGLAPIPPNLSDFWIDFLLAQGEYGKLKKDFSSELIAAVLKILYLKHGEEFETTDKMLQYYLDTFLTELAIENIRRRMNIEMTIVTLNTIFTNRKMNMSAESAERIRNAPPMCQ